MLRRIQLTNFRKHENLDVIFEPGLVVIRAGNEAGKSSLLEAIGYALFSSKGLREPLANVVTHGKTPSTLSVTLEFSHAGVLYTIRRSQGGAELEAPGRLITGQTEVSLAVESLLGAPASLASNLFLVSQNSIRGALAGGAKQTSALIEQLADFGLLDRIVEAITSNLPSGQVKTYEDRVVQAQAAFDAMQEPAPLPEPGFEAWADQQRELIAQQEFNLSEATTAVARFEEDVLLPVKLARGKHIKLRDEYNSSTKQLNEVCNKIALSTVPVPVDSGQLLQLRVDLARYQEEEKKRERARAAYSAYEKLTDDSEAMWDGTRKDFEAFIVKSQKDLQEVRTELRVIPAQLQAAQERVLTGMCQVCGLEYDQIPTVAEINTKAEIDILALRDKQKELERQAKTHEETARGVTFVQGRDRVKADFLHRYAEFVEVEDVSVPPRITWKGEPPASSPSITRLEKQVQDLEAQQKVYQQVEAQMKALEAQEDMLAKRGIELLDQLKDEKEVEEKYNRLLDEHTDLNLAISDTRLQLTTLRIDLQRLTSEYQAAVKVYEADQRARKLVIEGLSSAIAGLRAVNFNNGILKKVRGARPQIVDRLWTTVLSAVSLHFSKMRGIQSAITRQEGGFKVDGQPVEGLSGSTLDILGLAIRLALLKTFLPNVDFLILDEPAAACDEARHVSMLGVIATSNFEQTLLVTHSDVADAYSTQLVTL